jgi:hypothetical protein
MLSISIADQVQPFVEKQSTAAGFTTVNDYIHHLIMQEQTRLEQTEVPRNAGSGYGGTLRARFRLA